MSSHQPIRICIGTEPRTMVACRVLQYSVKKNLREHATVEFHELQNSPENKARETHGYTGFSLLRWTIPERFGFQGKAIYFDSDQLVLGDVAELWDADRDYPNRDSCVWCTTRKTKRPHKLLPFIRTDAVVAESSVMLIDCAKARDKLMTIDAITHYLDKEQEDSKRYKRVMYLEYLRRGSQYIPEWWNVRDGRRHDSAHLFRDSRTRLIHFTRVPTQPWYYPDHPARDIWERYMVEAIDDGWVQKSDIRDACRQFRMDERRPDGMHPYWLKYA